MKTRKADVLVVDDDIEMSALLCQCLTDNGFIPHKTKPGLQTYCALELSSYDLIILDLALVDGDGRVPCEEIRGLSDAPLIVLTSRGAPLESSSEHGRGADDYIVKPFEPRDFTARIETVLRRARRGRTAHRGVYEETRFGPWRLSHGAHHLIAGDGTIVSLSNAEFRLLAALLDAPDSMLTHSQLSIVLADAPSGKSRASLEEQIALLRAKLGEDVGRPRLLVSAGVEGFMIKTFLDTG